MADEPDQRTEHDDLLVLLRKVQRPSPDEATVASAKAAARYLAAMVRKGTASEAQRRICAQFDNRLAQLNR